jgi:hypothetical protein
VSLFDGDEYQQTITARTACSRPRVAAHGMARRDRRDDSIE